MKLNTWQLIAIVWFSALVGYHGGNYLRSLVSPRLTPNEQVALARTLAACLHKLAEHQEGNENHDDDNREADR